MMTKFNVGEQVVVSAATDATIYSITELLPNGACRIRQIGRAPNDKPYREQQFDISLLQPAPG